MDFSLFHNLGVGFSAAGTIANIAFAFAGCLIGTLIGVLPGIGSISAIAILLPFTFGLDPLSALIMLSGIYYGAQYGGSTTAILVHVPGEASAIITCIDGHQMARQGQAGLALAVAALGSFFAGCVGTLLIAAFGPILAGVAQDFNSPEQFALMSVGLIMCIILVRGSIIKALGMVFLGLLFGTVGTDPNEAVQRLTFGVSLLFDGIDFVVLVVGMFGIVEIIRNLEEPEAEREALKTGFWDVWPRYADLRPAILPAIRGTLLGSIIGILPGAGTVVASFSSYALEKKVARDPSRFGQGAIAGVAGPESANNAAAQTSFIPMLTLGIPASAVMVLMMGAMMIQGVQPGPFIMQKQPELFWGLIASMWIGNAMLVVLNLPLIGIWVRLLSIPYRFLYPAILLFCIIGVYSTNMNALPMMTLTAIFALFGWILLKCGFELVPFVLGFVLGPLMEENLRRSLLLSRGSLMIFLERPICAALLAFAVVLVFAIVLPQVRMMRQKVSAQQ
jgi:putative tricarboxylic transport membrane protein